MEISTFKEDLLSLQDFAKRLEKFILVESDYVEGSLVIGLSSKFGSGKTTFLKMWMTSIQEDKDKEYKPLVVFLNAWESDYYGDPLFAIISALIDGLEKKGASAKKLVDAAKDVGWFAFTIGGQVVKKITGIDVFEAGEIASTKNSERHNKTPLSYDAFSFYEARKNAMLSLKITIKDFVDNTEPKVLFLVDELDRCRPDYAISYLETIKHIFDVKGAVFLLAADRQQLENSAKSAFGADLDFDEYYRKFIHREISLPEISDDKYRLLASKYVRFYLKGNGHRKCFMQIDERRIDNISKLIGALKLTPRQIQEVFRIMGHMFDTNENEENESRLLWCLSIGSVLMAALKVGSPNIFHILGSGTLVPQEAVEFFRDKLNLQYYDWWFTLCLTGGGLKIENGKQFEEIFKDIGLPGKGDELQRNIYKWQDGWGHSRKNNFSKIKQKIEQLYQWI